MLDELNEAQRLAVETIEGPVMVMAGAGSGKTKVLTHRIAYILNQTGIFPSELLAVTFTNKAALEMKNRVQAILGIDTRTMWISTFHSFCARLLRIEADTIDVYFNHNFQIIDEDDSLKIIKNIVKQLELESYKPKTFKDLISRSKNFTAYQIKDPYLKRAYDKVEEEYRYYLREHNMLDFDDLIIETIDLFQKNPVILEKYQEKFQYILIDEFQDTNDLQYKLIFMLASRHHNIFVVGDDFQSIYSFRGAQIENIQRFRKDFLETKLILLEENYRSTEEILNLANHIIEHNPNQIKKVLYAHKKNGTLPFYYEGATEKGEAMFVLDKIKRFYLDGDKYKDCAVLYRTNSISRVFEDMLVKEQIPYRIYGGLSFFARKEIKDMIAYMRLILNFDDDFSFLRIVNEPKRKIGSALLEKLTAHSVSSKMSLFRSIETYSGTGAGVKSLNDFYKMIISMNEQLEGIPLPKLIDVILEETGYKDMLLVEDEDHERIGNIFEFKNALQEIDETSDEDNFTKLSNYLNDLSLRTDADKEVETDCVILSTFHQAKGLEFKNVFMVAMEEGIFPSEYHIDDLDIEEERRICYVGITRAMDRLYITSSKSRMLYGHSEYMMPSRFVKEMGPDLKNVTSGIKPRVKPIKVQAENKEDIHIGDKVMHNVFGKGIVVSVDDKGSVRIAFSSPTGVKTLMKNHPSYHKIS